MCIMEIYQFSKPVDHETKTTFLTNQDKMMEMGAFYKTIKSKQQFKTKIYEKNKVYEKYKNSLSLQQEVEADVILGQKSLELSQI